MTDQDTDAVVSGADIAWMRNLAAENARTPLKGGAVLMAAGLVFGGASLLHWAIVAGLAPWGPSAFALLWPIATILFLLFAATYGFRMRAKGGVRTAADRASGTVWSSVGFGIFALFISMGVVSTRLGGPTPFWLVPSIIMTFYGLGWAVSAAMVRSRALGGLSIASFIAAPVLAAFTGSSFQYLAYALALFGLMALPGWLLMKKADALRTGQA